MSETSNHSEDGDDGDRADWEGRHARTSPPSAGAGDDSKLPPMRIEWNPEDGEWDRRHAHVDRLADREESGRLFENLDADE